MRRTKIVATIGPASETEEMIRSMIEAGVDVFRFNMKHGNVVWHTGKMLLLEKVCKAMGQRVATLIDLQGPEVRIDGLPRTPMTVEKGDHFWFVKPGAEREGVVLDHPAVIPIMQKGAVIYADDGFLEFKVTVTAEDGFEVEVLEGGEIKDRKTVNFPGTTLDFPCLVDKDLELLSLAARHTVDYVALSFVRTAGDIEILRREMDKLKVQSAVIAKIEHPEAVNHFEEILETADGVMVARGDLGIEYPIEEVPALQKMIVQRAIQEGKPVIVATQMLESMHTHARPTRAEVSDVANAVYDRADAVMLSGESAVGKFPIRAVRMMNLIATKTEIAMPAYKPEVGLENGTQEEAMVAAAYQLAKTYLEKETRIKAFVVMTETGRSAQYLSRLRPGPPIFALSGDAATLDRLRLAWGVQPVNFKYEKNKETDSTEALLYLKERQLLHTGDKVIVLYGEKWGQPGATSVVRIQEVP